MCRSCDPSVGPPAAADSVFLATHEPCCMCISSIVWSGFKRCYYLFPYETTRDQGIPHDLNIMYELWRVPRYRERNAFCTTAGILPLIAALEDGEARAELEATVARITQRYDELSTKYHAEKAANRTASKAEQRVAYHGLVESHLAYHGAASGWTRAYQSLNIMEQWGHEQW